LLFARCCRHPSHTFARRPRHVPAAHAEWIEAGHVRAVPAGMPPPAHGSISSPTNQETCRQKCLSSPVDAAPRPHHMSSPLRHSHATPQYIHASRHCTQYQTAHARDDCTGRRAALRPNGSISSPETSRLFTSARPLHWTLPTHVFAPAPATCIRAPTPCAPRAAARNDKATERSDKIRARRLFAHPPPNGSISSPRARK